jgi:hypothetical protein
MKDYKSSSYYAGGTHAGNSTKIVHTMWIEDLNAGVTYHTSTKTGKVTKTWLKFGSGYKTVPTCIPIDKNTDYERALEMVEKTYEAVLTHNYSLNK